MGRTEVGSIPTGTQITLPSVKMSVGTSFENSALKSSFSLSSLGGSTASPTNGRTKQSVERPYHSLTKKRKDPNREAWRRSWGSTHSGSSQISVGMLLSSKDDLWAALQQNYDYIMDNQIIDSCKEVNGELLENSTPVVPVSSSIYVSPSSGFNRKWSLNQLIVEFTDMCQWLTAIQEEIYSSPENLSNRMLRLSKMSEITSSEGRLGKFCEQASAIADRIPEARGEVAWRVRHLQLKWESVTQALSPDARDSGEENGNVVDSEHETKCLRRWLHVMEGRLPPPSLAAARSWTPQELMRKVHEHQVLQREVQCAGRAVGSVRRACGGGAALERRWHLLCLRALEWQCHLEACVARLEDQNGVEQSDSEEEPALKQPRLARRRDRYPVHDHSNSSEDDPDDETYPSLESYPDKSGSELELDGDTTMDSTDEGTPVNDRQHEGTPVNECQHVPGSHEGTPVNHYPGIAVGLCTLEDGIGDCVDGHVDSSQDITMYDDDTQVSKTPPTVIKRQKKHVDSSRFNQSNRKSKNCATFYFKHHDTDSDRQVKSGIETDEKSQEESSEEEWTFTRQTDGTITDVMTSSVEIQCEFPMDIETPVKSRPVECTEDVHLSKSNETEAASPTPDLLKVREPTGCSKENINRLVSQAEALVQKQSVQTSVTQKKSKLSRSFKPLNFEESKVRDKEGGSSQNKMSRIKEWLRQHSSDDRTELTVQCTDNYDASGEYTTGESEAERQSEASEDVAPSTHAPSTLTPTNLTPTHNKVTLRKKRNNNGTRPWSVSCLSQLSYVCASREPTTVSGTSLHERTPDDGHTCRQPGMSISESALHTLSHAHTLARAHSRNKMQAGSTSSVKTTVQGNISSSTTINEGSCASCFENADPKQCSMRRKRLKLRRRQQEHLRQSHDGESHVLVRRVTPRRADRFVKSLSFSGRLSPQMEDKHDRSAASDPSCSRKTRFDTTSTSGNDSEDELLKQQLLNIASLRRSIERTHISSTAPETEPIKEQEQEAEQDAAPSFKLGPGGGGVRPRVGYTEPALLGRTLVEQAANWDLGCGDRDSDVDRSIHTAGTEEHSSFSEQAWDFYQEKYNSENYSEAPDSDAARRLLEFGDDYRNFLDSQSDCCSSLSAQQREPSPARRQRPAPRRSPALTDQEGVRRRKLISEGSDRKNKRGSTPHITDATAHVNTRTTNTPDIVDCVNRRTRKPSNSESIKSVTRDSDAFRITNCMSGVVGDSTQRRRLFSRESGEDSWERAAEEAGMAEVRSLVARSGSQLALAEAMFAKQESSPDLLRSSDYVRNPLIDNSLVPRDLASADQRRRACFAKVCFSLAALSVLIIVYVNLY